MDSLLNSFSHRAVRHLYFPCIRIGANKKGAMFVVFFFSAVIHEMLISVSTTTYYVFFNNVCPFAACLIILDLRHCDNILLDSIPHDSLLQLSWNDEVSQSYAMNRYQRKSSCYLLHYSQRINNFSHSQIPLVMITKYIDKVRPGSR